MSLTNALIRQIDRLGPLNMAEYMAQCLYHPTRGYYTNTSPLGADGDFVTAPEISQMFGELLGLALAQSWLDQGAVAPFCLAELGPGSGQLMVDVLRATRGVPGFHAAMRLHLCEVNPQLKATQAERLAAYSPTWVDDVTTLPDLPLFLLANEFFDCLPIRQFTRTDDWCEQLVAIQNGALCFASKPAGPVAESFPERPAGSVIELRPAANAIAEEIARKIAVRGGCALIVDYGDWGSDGDTLQALRQHRKTDPLDHPGQADLTAHVDFSALGNTARQHAQISGLTDQGLLLERLGITARAQALAKNLQGKALENHIAAHRRLTHGDEMGKLFKALAITPPNATQPPGFDHDAGNHHL